MHTASNCPKHLKLFLLLTLIFLSSTALPQNISLQNGFAHNDYWHKHPLYDALDNGYTHVEADVYLRNGQLIVAHILPILRRHKNLEDLYLRPIYDCVTGADSRIKCPDCPVTLMIDIKSDAERTYQALLVLLAKYRSIISDYENGVYVQRQLIVVITGHKPESTINNQTVRYTFIDQDLMRSRKDTVAKNLYYMASCRYSKMLQWQGDGPLPAEQRQRLCAFVNSAHRCGKKVRLWASPENKAVWTELLNCGVDLINTDRLAELRQFLLHDFKTSEHPVQKITAGLE